jgi:hypothetical protein
MTIINAQNLHGSGGGGGGHERRYAELAAELRAYDGIVVGVFDDPNFSGRETPRSLRYEHFAASWGQLPGVRVVSLDANQIRSHAILFRGRMDILVFPYGGAFPMEAFWFYSGQAFNYFLRGGGAVLTTGGIPFSGQASPTGEIIDTSTDTSFKEVFDKWVAKFGIKYYQCQVPPASERVNTDLLPELSQVAPWVPSAVGVVVTNSLHEPVPKCSNGNVFPERTPARQVIPLCTGQDRWGQTVCTSAVLTQDFVDGSRRIHFTHTADSHPLDPVAPHFAALMKGLFRLLSNRVVVRDVEPGFACYRQGEAVKLRGQVVSHSVHEETATLDVEIRSWDGTLLHHVSETVSIAPGQTIDREWTWAPDRLPSDECTVRLAVRRDGHVVSFAQNGFVVWDEAVLRNGPSVALSKDYFAIGGRPAFVTGTNYCESTRGEAMWFRPDVANIIRDHQQMHACGVNLIRPHYHHLKWFHDYLIYHHRKLPEFYSSLSGIADAMPDERVWRIWDMFMYLGQKYGIVYNGDLFTLVPEEMGDPRGWFGTVEAVYDLTRRPAQKAFLLALDRRYRDVPGITWDLFNEPYQVADQSVSDWVLDLRDALRADGSDRLLTVGGPAHLPDGVDYDCPHGLLPPDYRRAGARPMLLQELHFDRPEALSAELEQAEGLRTAVVTTLGVGGAGWCPWSWTRQMRLWQDTYEHHHTFPMEKWDDRLGMHTHDDGTLKPAGLVFKDLAMLLAGIEPISHDDDTRAVTTSAGVLTAQLAAQAGGGHSIIHAAGDRLLAGMALGRITLAGRVWATGPANAYLYVFARDGDIGGAKEIFVKCEQPGEIIVARADIGRADLVDLVPGTCRELAAALPFAVDKGQTTIRVDAEMTRYWLRLSV